MEQVKNQETIEKKSIVDEIIDQPYIVPFVNIYENENEFILKADMPGVSKENLELKLDDNNMTIVGKVDLQNELNKKYLLKEKRSGNYFRNFKLSDSVDTSKITAQLENGQVEIKLPKKDSVKPRNIEIL
ncbi:MAG: heat-shock protein Hsp20 [Ignavibacteriae bacterium HGW-Ignavibacteriae-2]|jgi:HSP20 family protein|nr:Hsp20/alpha crystallin family protein [Bacteroidota bacterium]PKL87714.1 MAG: heat-shock protein Hsp20 [Ignavibacteriae bacterium HGW-Ignavibacteriae-2]